MPDTNITGVNFRQQNQGRCNKLATFPGLGGTLDWKPSQEGYVLAAQNAGNLLMLLTGMWADRLNGKWMVMTSLVLCVSANAILPMVSPVSLWLTVLCRMAVGAADACLIPAATSLGMNGMT
ncbi:unnamed protein product, partial [Mesorhabditis belari]|uniref:Major facilitator superfamily (MFS) profile domain-containing protein n=1 Tax=Mesorhabditis belari TaxID=2138241 RepID=A0AAF3F5W3_9BILA